MPATPRGLSLTIRHSKSLDAAILRHPVQCQEALLAKLADARDLKAFVLYHR